MYDYFYENQNEQYLFLQIPLILIKGDQFKCMSDSSKILYSLLLSRTGLSSKNGWRDEQGRVYIIFTIEEIMEDLNCAKEKATKLMKELKDTGLVETVRRGLGLPNIIYVKNFATPLKSAPKNAQTPVNTQKFENRTSEISKTELQQVRKSNSSYINNNNIYSSNIDLSQSQSQSQTEAVESPDMTLTMTATPDVSSPNNEKRLSQTVTYQSPELKSLSPADEYNTYRLILQENIEYSHYLTHKRSDIGLVDELINCMLDVICTRGDTVKINGEEKNRQMVISQYMKINSMDIDHVLSKYREQHHKITHLHSYLKTMLYTVRQEGNAWAENAVRADGLVW